MHLVCSGCCQTKLLSRGSCKIADAWHSFSRKSNIRNMLDSRSSLSVNDDTFHSIHIVSLPNTFRFLRIANENPNWIWWCFPIITAFYELERYDASTDDQMEEYLGMAYLVGFCTASYRIGCGILARGIRMNCVCSVKDGVWSSTQWMATGFPQSDADYRDGNERKIVTTNIVNFPSSIFVIGKKFGVKCRTQLKPSLTKFTFNVKMFIKCSKREISINQLKLNAPLAGFWAI